MANRELVDCSPYRQFSKGQDLRFTLNKLCPDGSVATEEYDAKVEAVKGGGFFGRVLVLDGPPFVLKTALPDPGHDFLRRINWGARDFPPQVSELEAKLGQVTTDLIHEAIYPITQVRFHAPVYAPKSFGYARLRSTFAQAVERLYGRPPRYDNGQNEFQQFRAAQVKLTEIAYQLGLEQVGQIHSDNPFAMANLWWNPSLRRWEWVDTQPAIRHTMPRRLFKFHRQIRERFYPRTKAVTFDTIHTDMYLETVRRNERLFSEEVLDRIQGNIALYESLMAERAKMGESPRNFRGLAYAGKESAADFGRAVVGGAKGVIGSPVRIVRMLTDPTYTAELVLDGVRKAYETNTITAEEFQQETALLMQNLSQEERGSKRFLKILEGFTRWSGLYAYYHVSGSLLKVPELAVYVWISTQEDWVAKIAMLTGAFLGFRAVGGLQSYSFTKGVGFLTKRNLDAAAILSAIPAIGLHLAISAQICVDQVDKSKSIWHYTVRKVIAKISQLHPAGGWGTDVEGRLWNLFGERFERWFKH